VSRVIDVRGVKLSKVIILLNSALFQYFGVRDRVVTAVRYVKFSLRQM
jgi:hypothetical protein